jgi:4-carboxymuconolactone decarboxylase
MRLPLIAPADLGPEQRPIYEDMRAGIERSFQGFKSIAENGALIGPWNPWLHEPKFRKLIRLPMSANDPYPTWRPEKPNPAPASRLRGDLDLALPQRS